MAMAWSQQLLSMPLPVYVFFCSCLVYLCGGPIVNLFQTLFPIDEDQKPPATGSTLDLAEKGSLKMEESLSDEEIFELEKRAFFSKVVAFPIF